MKRSILGIQVKRLLHSFLLTAFFSQAAFAHEFWIEPKQYQLEPGAMIEASLRNGEFFVGSTVSFYKGSTNRFELVIQGQTEKIEPRLGTTLHWYKQHNAVVCTLLFISIRLPP